MPVEFNGHMFSKTNITKEGQRHGRKMPTGVSLFSKDSHLTENLTIIEF